MGSKVSFASPALAKTMLVIGGCELPLEKNPYSSIESVTLNPMPKVETLLKPSLIPVRGPTAHVYQNTLYIFGGCRGYRDHLNSIQLYDFTT